MSQLVSILLPTRGRVANLMESLRSLAENAHDPNNVEVLIRTDEDDDATNKYLMGTSFPFYQFIFTHPRGNGYADLHHMYDGLCHASTGRLLYLWNDDAVMQTKNWDLELQKFDDGKLCFIQSRDPNGAPCRAFPIVHRSYWETLGRYSASAHNDTYLGTVFSAFPHLIKQCDNAVLHRARELIARQDRTHMDARAQWPQTKGHWNSAEVQQAVRDDVEKLRKFLETQ